MLLAEAETKLNAIDKNKAPIPGRNKGGRGQWVEKQLGMDLSSKLNDFDDGELKTFKSKQTIEVTMLQHCFDQIFDRSISFSESNVGRKLKDVLFVKFDDKTGKYVDTYVFHSKVHMQLYYDLSEDYNYICEEIRRRYDSNQLLNTINGPRDKNGVHKLLQIRTKGSKRGDGKYTPLCYNGKVLKDKSMGFYLTRKFENILFP